MLILVLSFCRETPGPTGAGGCGSGMEVGSRTLLQHVGHPWVTGKKEEVNFPWILMSWRAEGKELRLWLPSWSVFSWKLSKSKSLEQDFRRKRRMQGVVQERQAQPPVLCSRAEPELCRDRSSLAALEPEHRCAGLGCAGGGCGSTDLVRLSPRQHGAWLAGRVWHRDAVPMPSGWLVQHLPHRVGRWGTPAKLVASDSGAEICWTRGLGLVFNMCCSFMLQRGAMSSLGTVFLYWGENLDSPTPGWPEVPEGWGTALRQERGEDRFPFFQTLRVAYIAISAANPNCDCGAQGGARRDSLPLHT